MEISLNNADAWRRRLTRVTGGNRPTRRVLSLGTEPLAVSEAREIQRETAAMIRQVIEVREMRVGGSVERLAAMRIQGPLNMVVLPLGRTPTLMVEASTGDRVRYSIVRLLESGGLDRLRRCPSRPCENVFVKAGKKTFCSPKCQAREYMRSYEPGANGR